MTDSHPHRNSPVNASAWRVLAWIGVALQAVALVAVLFLQRWNGAWTIAAFLVLSLAFLLMKERIPSLISFLVVLAALLNAGGWAWEWFNQFTWFDEVIHLFTAFSVIAALMYRWWTGGSVDFAPGSARFIVAAAALGLGLGILWEIAEALFLNLAWSDTLTDLVIDTVGAALGGAFAGWALRAQGARQGALA